MPLASDMVPEKGTICAHLYLRRSDTGSRIMIFHGSTKYHQNISPDKTYILTLFKNFYQVMYFANEYSIDLTCKGFHNTCSAYSMHRWKGDICSDQLCFDQNKHVFFKSAIFPQYYSFTMLRIQLHEKARKEEGKEVEGGGRRWIYVANRERKIV